MDYLRDNASGLEVDYDRFLQGVDDECEDPQWNIENHPARPILKQFPNHFKAWVSELERIAWWKRAGYPLDKNDLSPLEWSALALLESDRSRK